MKERFIKIQCKQLGCFLFICFALLYPTEQRLVSLNPKFPLFEEMPSSGPLLLPQPERYLVNYNQPPYSVSTDVVIEIKTSNILLKNCDVVKFNVEKYRRLMNAFVNNVGKTGEYPLCDANNDNDKDSSGTTSLSLPKLNELHLFINNKFVCDLNPNFVDIDSAGQMNESYHIEVQAGNGKAILYSDTVWGMIRGLETFSQLLYVRHQQANDVPDCLQIVINVGHVWDQPRFRYRSLMIDTARHFLPVPLLIKNLDSMAYNKLNVLHWHLNDDQSFPFNSQTFDNFSRLASYSRHHVYQRQDIVNVINEARLRGIQVIMELDTPGHSSSLGIVFPEIMSKCNRMQPDNLEHYAAGQQSMYHQIISPAAEKTFQILAKLLAEFRTLFPSDRIHLGMDDVTYDCWANDPDILKFMSLNNIDSYEQLEQYYLDRMFKLAASFQWKPIIWQDAYDKDLLLTNDTIVQVWKDKNLLDNDTREWRHHLERLVRQNQTAILSACYFLSLIEYGQDWKQLYECDPHDFANSNEPNDDLTNKESAKKPISLEAKRQFIIGGEAVIWGEYIDSTNFLSRIWPRASAVAERLWSPISVTGNFFDVDVQIRLDAQRCRLLRRGIPAQPISTGFCEYLNNVDNNNQNNAHSTKSFYNRPNILPTIQSIDDNRNEKQTLIHKLYGNDSVPNANRIIDNIVNGKENDFDNKITSTLSTILSSSPSSSMHQIQPAAAIQPEIEPRISLMSKNNGIIYNNNNHNNKHSGGGFMYPYHHNGSINGFQRYNALILIVIYVIWFN